MSEIRATTISDLAGTGPATLTGQYAAKAWVNFDGTGTVAIRQSGNVSSITDNNTGDYTVNFATAQVDFNYAFTCNDNYYGIAFQSTTQTTTQIRVYSVNESFVQRDAGQYCVTIFR